MDDLVAQFVTITDAPIRKAETYLRVSDFNLQQAIQLFFETGGADMEDPPSNSTPTPPVPAPALTSRLGGNDDLIEIDDDIEDEDLMEVLRASEGGSGAAAGAAAGGVDGANSGYDDEALARQLQDELYGEGRGGNGGRDGGEVRAPIARTRETLVDDDDDYGYSGLMGHMSSRRRGAPAPRGIFNQRSSSVWDESEASRAERRSQLADATGGASESSSKSVRLAEMYRPPFEIISPLSLEDAKSEAREEGKWILVNVQDSSLFACQTLNRDIWKDSEVMATVKENFLFLQIDRNGIDGRDYIRYYLQKAADPSARFDPTVADLFPHIAIIDPRTGEQVKVWKTVPKEPMDFVMQLHEFLERYSLNADAKNPVQRTSKVKPNVAHMTEDEMMQLAMQNSLGAAATTTSTSDDPDALTKDTSDSNLMEFEESPKGKQPAATEDEEETPFSRIRADAHHAEPPPGPETTRIQFKMHDSTRVVRRFLLKDRVERLFEYVKADMLPEQEAKKPEEERKGTPGEFGLVCLGKKLIEFLDMTVDEAGLRNGTVMVELMDD